MPRLACQDLLKRSPPELKLAVPGVCSAVMVRREKSSWGCSAISGLSEGEEQKPISYSDHQFRFFVVIIPLAEFGEFRFRMGLGLSGLWGHCNVWTVLPEVYLLVILGFWNFEPSCSAEAEKSCTPKSGNKIPSAPLHVCRVCHVAGLMLWGNHSLWDSLLFDFSTLTLH